MAIKHPSQIDNATDFLGFTVTTEMRNNVQMMAQDLGARKLKRRNKREVIQIA